MDKDKLQDFRKEISELRACGLLDENITAELVKTARKRYKKMTNDERVAAKQETDKELKANREFMEMLDDDRFWTKC